MDSARTALVNLAKGSITIPTTRVSITSEGALQALECLTALVAQESMQEFKRLPNPKYTDVVFRKTAGASAKTYRVWVPLCNAKVLERIASCDDAALMQYGSFKEAKEHKDLVDEITAISHKSEQDSLRVALIVNKYAGDIAKTERETERFMFRYDSGQMTEAEKCEGNTLYEFGLKQLPVTIDWPIIHDNTLKSLSQKALTDITVKFLTLHTSAVDAFNRVAKDLGIYYTTRQYMLDKLRRQYHERKVKLPKKLTHEIVEFSDNDVMPTLIGLAAQLGHCITSSMRKPLVLELIKHSLVTDYTPSTN